MYTYTYIYTASDVVCEWDGKGGGSAAAKSSQADTGLFLLLYGDSKKPSYHWVQWSFSSTYLTSFMETARNL